MATQFHGRAEPDLKFAYWGTFMFEIFCCFINSAELSEHPRAFIRTSVLLLTYDGMHKPHFLSVLLVFWIFQISVSLLLSKSTFTHATLTHCWILWIFQNFASLVEKSIFSKFVYLWVRWRTIWWVYWLVVYFSVSPIHILGFVFYWSIFCGSLSKLVRVILGLHFITVFFWAEFCGPFTSQDALTYMGIPSVSWVSRNGNSLDLCGIFYDPKGI